MKKFKVISSKVALDSPWMPVEEQLVELPNGETTTWMINRNNDAVIVVPRVKTGKFLVQKNYKHGSGEFITEFCAGVIDAGESAEKAAHRELLEETGFKASKMVYLGKTFSNPTGSSMRYHFFLAENCEKKQEPSLEAAEQIEVFVVETLKEVFGLFQGSGSSSACVAALSYVEDYYKK